MKNWKLFLGILFLFMVLTGSVIGSAQLGYYVGYYGYQSIIRSAFETDAREVVTTLVVDYKVPHSELSDHGTGPHLVVADDGIDYWVNFNDVFLSLEPGAMHCVRLRIVGDSASIVRVYERHARCSAKE